MKQSKRVLVLDYGLGNAPTLLNALRFLGLDASMTSILTDDDLESVVFLPGVGSFDAGVERLHSSRNFQVLKEAAQTPKFNIIGICLGMQLMLEKSAEGEKQGLGVFKGDVVELLAGRANVGWNYLYSDSFFAEGVVPGYWPRLYFVHSYRARVQDERLVLAESTFEGETYPCIIGNDQHLGIQCHPERSHADGLMLLKTAVERLACEL